MHVVLKDLIKDGPVITDGSWGTQLQIRGLARGECPDSWNLSKPEEVEEVARMYVEAGSRIILTNTFGSNRFVLGKYSLDDKIAEINEAGVRISKRAAADRALVFASIGPSGRMLVTKDVSEDDLLLAFREQAMAQCRAGADGIVVETMMDVNEARIAVMAAKETGLPVVASMVFDSGKMKDRTMMGNTPEQAAEELAKAGADAVGANCGQGIEGFIAICARLRKATGLPIWMKPNAGLPVIVDGQVLYRTSPDDFAGYIPELLDSGANLVGGCCGTNADFIRAIRKAVSR